MQNFSFNARLLICRLFVAFSMLMILCPLTTFAWSGRGHHIICESAGFLVEDPNLAAYLKIRAPVWGHVCNIPDIYWKSTLMDAESIRIGRITHYLDLDMLDIKPQDFPTDLQKLKKDYEGKPNSYDKKIIQNFEQDIGSIWWRAEQFFKIATATPAATWKTFVLPKTFKEQQDEKLPYNKAVYDLWINLSLMGHFVGDASQPFHNTIDHDGYHKGHGGIHSYYEDFVLGAMPYELSQKVFQRAKELRKSKPSFLKPGLSIVERMKQLSLLSLKDLDRVYKNDVLKKKSIFEIDKMGVEKKVPAERDAPEKAIPRLGPILVEQLARSSALLSVLFEEAYEKVGKPDLSPYRSFRYPYTHEFVPPNYQP